MTDSTKPGEAKYKNRIGQIRGEFTALSHKLGWLQDWKADDTKTAEELRACAREASHQASRLSELAIELEGR